MTFTENVDKLFSLIEAHPFLSLVIIVVALVLFSKWYKKRKARKGQEIQPEEQKDALSILQPEYMENEAGDIVDISNNQILKLNEEMKRSMAGFNKMMRESKTKLEEEERQNAVKAQAMINRSKLLRRTKTSLTSNIKRTDIAEEPKEEEQKESETATE